MVAFSSVPAFFREIGNSLTPLRLSRKVTRDCWLSRNHSAGSFAMTSER
jgi:hypothetical protein